MSQIVYHTPILKEEILYFLKVKSRSNKVKKMIIDATLGTGGHTISFLKNGAIVMGIEADRESLEVARTRIKKACPAFKEGLEGQYILVQGNFKDIEKIAKANNFLRVDGVLFDLGISFFQLKSEKRGFSFLEDSSPLDMRIDPSTQTIKACDLLNILDEKKLLEIFLITMKKKEARQLVKLLIEARKEKKIESVSDFLALIRKVVKGKKGRNKATLPFLALRIVVNDEINNLKKGLEGAFSLLKRGGRIGVITFHSIEDGIVKRFIKSLEKEGKAIQVTKDFVSPSVLEIDLNPSARSARLRVLEKI